jgi:hypothetical protein
MSNRWPADEVTRVPVADLIPYARNSRTHSESQVAQIAASIQEWGFTNPVIVDEDGVIIAGHGRVMAAQQLGLPEVPAMTARGWTDAQKRAYVIADNRLALNAGWDYEKLAAELDDLRDGEFDLNLLGFEQKELNELIGTPNLPPLNPDTNSGDGPPSYVIQYNIIFDDEDQQTDWYGFLRYLKQQIPEAETVGQRLQIFVRNRGFFEEG